ncbi:uncharacterized protein DUF4132 [Chitinophaga dinghuensis]|uniref:Uncharacterized protein DUF4132 n=1 Tax=Chitinophaga dinghuensis TaxID=1539050 RepID=A0A327VY98_9BACT|nr:DUF4132 domain-containing protein [Chitinophaga dinghuensis]RAJ82021.1 uncharacterized protein DUF4132 [Chitinophaga dinghuensis]
MRTIHDFPLPAGQAWEDLFTLFLSLDNHKLRPSKEWYEKAAVLLEEIGHENYIDLTANWLTTRLSKIHEATNELDDYWGKQGKHSKQELFLTSRMEKIVQNQRPEWVKKVLDGDYMYTKENPLYSHDGYYYFYTLGGRILRGVIHTNTILKNEVFFNVMDAIMKFSPEVSMDILYIYSKEDPTFAVPRLMAVRDFIKHKTYKKAIDTAVAKFGEKGNKTGGAEKTKEQFVPELNFNHRHQLMVKEGGYMMGIDLLKTGPTEIVILENGRPAVKVPSAVQKELTTKFKPIRQELKKISTQYTLQKNRVEEIYRHNREWKFEEWEPYYISHPFTGAIGKLLIWEFTNGNRATSAIYQQGGFVNLNGENVEWAEDKETTVRLWHPVTASSEATEDWRRYCIDHQLKQPFRQAFREVYRANENDDKWTELFEGHIVKQKQYEALCKMRGWSTGSFKHKDSSFILPAYNLSAYFQIADQLIDEKVDGRFLQVTGIIHFERNKRELPIQEIPPVAFSEIMRDIDMIVSVSTIGGEYIQVAEVMEQTRNYYNQYAKRKLSPIAAVRRDILQMLLPSLAFGDRCKLEGEYLYVTGRLASYKIHLSIGLAYNSKTDRYIGIRPNLTERSATQYLPDEGDLMLTVILSKASILATDNEITDKEILPDIRPSDL